MDTFILISAIGIFIGLVAGEKNAFTDVGRANNALAGFLGATAGADGISTQFTQLGYDPQVVATQLVAAAIGAFVLQTSLGMFANMGRS